MIDQLIELLGLAVLVPQPVNPQEYAPHPSFTSAIVETEFKEDVKDCPVGNTTIFSVTRSKFTYAPTL